MLDKRGNNKDSTFWGCHKIIGGENYYPPVGWWKYGLNVMNKYDNVNNDWLSNDNRPGEWCISYSGLSKFKNGIEKQYEKEKDIRYTGNVGNEIYTTPIPEIMERNTEMININGVNYKMGFMLQ